MSIFSELIPKIKEISNVYSKNLNDDLKVAFECLDKFEEEFQNGRSRGRDKAQKDKIGTTTLQSINEDDDEQNKAKVPEKQRSSNSNSGSTHTSTDSKGEKRASKKRSKHEVDDMMSPEVDKRQKRNASVKAQTNITKQVNVNLSAKLRRENSSDIVEKNIDKLEKNSTNKVEKSDKGKTSNQSSRRRQKEDEKENAEPNLVPAVQIKEEKLSLPPVPMDMDSLPLEIPIKQEANKDDIAMPPPAMPVPKPRKVPVKSKSEESEEETGKKRTTRTKKQPVEAVPPPVPATRQTRASSRSTRQTESEEQPPTEGRPKRTRAKKKVSVSQSDTQSNEVDSTQTSQETVSATASPAEKPRPKRTRRGKTAQKEPTPSAEPIISPKEERISHPTSPILQEKTKKNKDLCTTVESAITINSTINMTAIDKVDGDLEETRVISMDKTMVLPNGVYNHTAVTSNCNMNATVVIERADIDGLAKKPQNVIMDATVVLDKGQSSNLTEDNSLITDDESEQELHTPPKEGIPQTQPSSAVKEKVQQFEEMASRVTRTKTRAMAKKEEQTDNQTPPDKISKPILSAETLSKMNSMIFNGKPSQMSCSASKPRAAAPAGKSLIPSSTSKLSSISKHKEAAEEIRNSRITEEDARKKKEAMLEAKREQQKRKREEKMAAAAAARSQAERDRKAQLEAAAKERMEKQAHADAGKLERMKEAERKKQELARKVAETEERRKAEETARMQRLAEEQRKALAQRRKQIEEQEAMKKEAAIMAKEIEKKQKEYMDKQKMKQRLEDKIHTPLKTPGTPGGYSHVMEPVYMADGFQYLNSDEDEEHPARPVPEWSTSKGRKPQLEIQSHLSPVHVERLFLVRVHSPDLREIFPNIERARLKRTSSAVWRTPPKPQPLTTVLE